MMFPRFLRPYAARYVVFRNLLTLPLAASWAIAGFAQSVPTLVLVSPTNQPNIRLGDASTLTAEVKNYTGEVNRVVFYVASSDGFLLTLTDSVAPFQVTWTNSVEGFYSITASAFLSNGSVLSMQPFFLKSPNYVEILGPAPGSVFITPVDIPLLVRLQKWGHFNLWISNQTNLIIDMGIIPDPIGLVDDVVTYDWNDLPPGQYTIYAALSGSYTPSGQFLSGPVGSQVSFVVLDPHTAADTDGDGMPDMWETKYGLDPRRADATEDADGDGMTNYEEMLAGTDPSDPKSNLSIYLARISGGWLELFFLSAGGKTYHLERSNALVPSGWSQLGLPQRGHADGIDGFRVPPVQLRSGDLFRVVLETQ